MPEPTTNPPPLVQSSPTLLDSTLRDLPAFMNRGITILRDLGHVMEPQEKTLTGLRDRLAEGRFQLAVLGQFKRGKSTLLNALLGEDILGTGILKEGQDAEIGFQGVGCAISTASASMMTERLKGKTPEEVEKIFEQFHDLVTGKGDAAGAAPEMGKLAAFSGVSEFPVRVKCATLVWHTLKAALEGRQQAVSTE